MIYLSSKNFKKSTFFLKMAQKIEGVEPSITQ